MEFYLSIALPYFNAVLVILLLLVSNRSIAAMSDRIMALEVECDKFDAHSCGEVGRLYYKAGKIQVGFRKLIKGCNLKDYSSCTSVGLIYVRQERMDLARSYLENACKKNYDRACIILKVLAINKQDAIGLYKNACRANDDQGCVEHALVEYKEGSRPKAKEIFKLMCESRDNVEACGNLGAMSLQEGEIEDGVRLLIESCNKGLLTSCVEYALWDYKNKNKKRALDNLKMACDKDEMSGCIALGEIAEDEGRMNDARNLYKSACEKYSRKGCRKLVGL